MKPLELDPRDEVMYKNIVYNKKSNKIQLWWNVNGKDMHDSFEYQHEFYQLARPQQITPNMVKDTYRRPMVKKVVPRRSDIPKTIPWNEMAESDINEETKFLHSYFQNVELTPNYNNVQTMYYDIEVAIGHTTLNPNKKVKTRIISTGVEFEITLKAFEQLHPDDKDKMEVFDDEQNKWLNYFHTYYSSKPIFPKASEAKYPVNAIAQYFTKEKKLYVYSDKPFKYTNKDKTPGSMDDLKSRLKDEAGVQIKEVVFLVINDEKKLLETFIKTMHKHKTDIISGWNINKFDNPYVSQRLINIGSTASFSPLKQQYCRTSKKTGDITFSYKGITVLDYIEVYRDKFTFDNKGYYSLDNIARIELGKHKLEYDMTMYEFYTREWDEFMLYNMIDTMLLPALDDKKGFMNLALISAHNAKIPIESVMGTIQGLTGLIMKYLHNQQMVLNDRNPQNRKEDFPGGYSWCEPGLYKYCISFDIQSMYPNLLSQHNIGVETSEQWADRDLSDVVRINDPANKKSYFFWPDDIINVGRKVDGKITPIKVEAQNILPTDKVILYPNENGINYQGQPNWKYDMGHSFHDKYIKQ